MKISRKITIGKKEQKILNEFLDMCTDLELDGEDVVVNLLNAFYGDESEFETKGAVYDIEYID